MSFLYSTGGYRCGHDPYLHLHMFSSPSPKPTSWIGWRIRNDKKRIAHSTNLLKSVANMKAGRVVSVFLGSYLGHLQPLSSSYVLFPTLVAFLSTEHAISKFLIAYPRVELTA